MEQRGLWINIAKIKIIVSGKDQENLKMKGQFHCGECDQRVGVKSVLCARCEKWINKYCS